MKRAYEQFETERVAQEVLETLPKDSTGAVVVGLQGSLGAGKTTLVQSIAQALGVSDTVVSPTFVIAKWYNIPTGTFDTLVHIDAYRIEHEDELIPLGIDALLQTPRTLVIIEWPEKIPAILSTVETQFFVLSHQENGRHIEGPTVLHHA